MPAGSQRSMASINVEEKGRELWKASWNGEKDEVKAMIEALSPREEWTQVLNWKYPVTFSRRERSRLTPRPTGTVEREHAAALGHLQEQARGHLAPGGGGGGSDDQICEWDREGGRCG